MQEAAIVFLGLGALSILTVGLVYPYYRLRRARFVVGRHRFGATGFDTAFSGGDFYATYILALLIIIGAMVPLFIVTFAVALMTRSGGAPPGPSGFFVSMAFMYALYLLAFCYVRASLGNATLNGSRVGPLQLRSTLRTRDLFWLYVSNIVAILATLGLATPWATLRMFRYRAQRLVVLAYAPLETLGASTADRATATGSEVSDLFDVDVSL